jgi:hypothetical protein
MVYADNGTMISNDVCSTMLVTQSDSDGDDSDGDPMATMAVKTLRLGTPLHRCPACSFQLARSLPP